MIGSVLNVVWVKMNSHLKSKGNFIIAKSE